MQRAQLEIEYVRMTKIYFWNGKLYTDGPQTEH